MERLVAAKHSAGARSNAGLAYSCLAEGEGADKAVLMPLHNAPSALTRSPRPCHKGARAPKRKATIIAIYRPHRHDAGSVLRKAGGAALCLLLIAGLSPAEAKTEKAEKTEKPAAAQQFLPPDPAIGAPPKRTVGTTSGLPVPRFVSLKSGRINVRRGPGDDYPIEWVFAKKGLPVEVTAESDQWRRIRDNEGDIGWVWHSMLDGRRTAIVQNKTHTGEPVALLTEPNPTAGIIAYAEPGVIAQIKACKAAWCELKASGYEGWVERSSIWGTYSDENFE